MFRQRAHNKWRIISFTIFAVMSLSILGGCYHAISKQVRKSAIKEELISRLANEPDKYKGKVFIFGGEIVGIKNAEGMTEIEVLEKPLNFDLSPRRVDISRGRFLLKQDGYLDPAIYRPGRRLTVAGKLEGVEERNIGEMPLKYPVFKVIELHLWRESLPREHYHPNPLPPPPFFRKGPYWGFTLATVLVVKE